MPKETAAGERRVALVPEVVRRLVAAEHEVTVEPGAGVEAAESLAGAAGGAFARLMRALSR